MAFDVETYLIGPAQQAPRLVCMSYAGSDGSSGVLLAPDAVRVFAGWLQDGGLRLVAHNAAFDVASLLEAAAQLYGADFGVYVAQLIFNAYSQDRIICTMIQAKLLDLAAGTMRETKAVADLPSQSHLPIAKKAGIYTLAGCVWHTFGIDRGADKAAESVRFRFSEVAGVPVERWPAGFASYALQDSLDALALYKAFDTPSRAPVLANAGVRSRFAFAPLQLMSIWGQRTNEEETAKVQAYCEGIIRKADSEMLAAGLMREEWSKGAPRNVATPAVVRDLVARAYAQKGQSAPSTAPSATHAEGQVQYGADSLRAIETLYENDPQPALAPLRALARSTFARGIHSKYLPVLWEGTQLPIHPYYNPLLLTGRTSASKYAQTPPRNAMDCAACGSLGKRMPAGASRCPKCGGYVADVRRCYEARKGRLFAFADFEQIELCALGQSMLDLTGRSTIADAISAGKDLHCLLGADLAACDYESFKHKAKVLKLREFVDWRQYAKGGNFGLPGLLGAAKFVDYLKGYEVYIDLAESKRIKAAWLRRWPDMRDYFAAIEAMGFSGFGSTATIQQPRTGLIRGSCEQPAACNFMFQSLTAFGALDAGFALCREMYADPNSPLFGSRLTHFLHDEYGAEVPETRYAAAAERMGQVMRCAMQAWIPQVPIVGCVPAITERWYKAASAVRAPDGSLEIWRPAPEGIAA